MLLKTHFQTAINDFSKLSLHPSMKCDARIAGPFFHAAQEFVIKAEEVGLKQNTTQPYDGSTNVQELTKAVQLFANAKGNVEEDVKEKVQELVDYLYDLGVTATTKPVPQQAPQIKTQPRPLWGPKA